MQVRYRINDHLYIVDDNILKLKIKYLLTKRFYVSVVSTIDKYMYNKYVMCSVSRTYSRGGIKLDSVRRPSVTLSQCPNCLHSLKVITH